MADVTPGQTAAAMQLAMRIGDLFQASGQSANDSVVLMRRVCHAYGLRRVQVDITSTAIVVTYYEGDGPNPITAMRTVKPAQANLTKTTDLNRLVRDIAAGESLAGATERLNQIRAAAPPYPPWLAMLGNAGISPAVQLAHTTNPMVLVLALVTGLGINRLLAGLQRLSMPAFFQQLAGGWLIVAVTALTSWAGTWQWTSVFHGLNPTLIAVGGIVQLVAGMKFVAAGQDAIDGFFLTATARLLEVLMLTAGIVAGLVSGLTVTSRLHVLVSITPEMVPNGALLTQYVGVMLASICFVIGGFADWRTIALAAAGAALAWFGVTTTQAGLGGVVTADFVGALLAAFVTTLLVRRTSIPGFAVVSGALLGLVPGMRVYNGLAQIVGTSTFPASPSLGAATLLVAGAVALAIAAGASLGMYVGRPVGDRIMRLPQVLYGHLRHRGDGATVG